MLVHKAQLLNSAHITVESIEPNKTRWKNFGLFEFDYMTIRSIQSLHPPLIGFDVFLILSKLRSRLL